MDTENLTITTGNKNDFKTLEKSGNIDLRENVKLEVPNLKESGYIHLSKNAKLEIPNLKKSGNISLRENAKLEVPNLKKSGYIYLWENAKLEIPNLSVKENVAILNSKEYKVVYNDNITFFVESTKTLKEIKIYSGLTKVHINEGFVSGTKTFLAEKDGFSSHGETVKEAISDLHFKITSERLKNEPIKEDTEITVNYYRLITGACIVGCKDFMDKNGLSYKLVNGEPVSDNNILAKDLLILLEKDNSYGYSKFKSLILVD